MLYAKSLGVDVNSEACNTWLVKSEFKSNKKFEKKTNSDWFK